MLLFLLIFYYIWRIVINPNLSRLGTENAFVILAKAEKLKQQGKDIINLGIGQPDFRTPEHIVEASIKALNDCSSILISSSYLYESNS